MIVRVYQLLIFIYFTGRDLKLLDASLQSRGLCLHPNICILSFLIAVSLHYSTGWTAALGFPYTCITTALIGQEYISLPWVVTQPTTLR